MSRYRVVTTRLIARGAGTTTTDVEDFKEAENLAAFFRQDRRDAYVTIYGLYAKPKEEIALRHWKRGLRGKWKQAKMLGGFEY